MLRFLGLATFAALIGASTAFAQTCTSYPYTLTNGAPTDATQVTANFNCALLAGAAHFTGNVGIDTTTPGSALQVNGGAAIGYSASTAAPSNGLAVSGALGIGTTTPSSQFYEAYATTYAASVSTPAFNFNAAAGADPGGTTDARLFNVSATINGGNNAYSNSAFITNAYYIGSATLTKLQGIGAGVRNTGTGTTTIAYPLSTIAIVSNGAITQNQNLWIRSPQITSPGVIGTSYGIYLDTQAVTGVTTGFGIYQAGTDHNYFAGAVGIATTSLGTYLLNVNGAAYATSWNTPSDARLKTKIVEVMGALDLIERLRPVRFDWLPPEEREIGRTLTLPVGERQVGLIAQEVETVVPEAVSAPKNGSDTPYSVKDENLIALLIAAVKEQETEIQALKTEVAAIEAAR